MAILKCKMCGGDIELSADKTFGTCESCGSTMTFPKVDDEQRANRFNRGNHFRRTGEFDKALAVYERIVQEDENDAEAHWCCALCRFGIEYVEDPNTFEYLPTCHRASFDSFLEDVDYLAALEHSDGITRRQYQKDAAKIAEVQRGILATSQNEEPFDVFICYKESENDGSRTRDSLLAQEIYYQLTEQGRRVFFSRITLEDKAGTEYEPYIFAALNSAKVMILVTTSAEHANAVWVKNEWSRFLSLMRKDRSKLLLPCYRDMDPYDLPEALSVLQSYDMSKIGFIQDLIRGVNKVLDASAPKAKETVKETVVVQQGNANAAPLLRRAFMFLEDGDWNSANEYCEKVLDIDPENAEAYLGKLMAELHVKTREGLKDQPQPFDGGSNYKKAFRFGDEKLKAELSDDIAFIKDRNETARKDGIYEDAKKLMQHGDYERAISTFAAIRAHRDAEAKIAECKELAEKERKNGVYADALALHGKHSIEKQQKAIELFKSIPGWRDADEKIVAAEKKIEEIKAQEEADRKEAERKAEQERIAAIKRKKRVRIQRFVIAGLVCCFVFAILLFTVIIPGRHYRDAIELYNNKQYDEAIVELESLNGFRDSIDQIKNVKLSKASMLYDQGQYQEAIGLLTELEGYKDSKDQIFKCNLAIAGDLITKKEYKEAKTLLQSVEINDVTNPAEAFAGIKKLFHTLGDEYLSEGNNTQAAVCYTYAGEPLLAKETFDFSSRMRVSDFTTAAITNDGKVLVKTNAKVADDPSSLNGAVSFVGDSGLNAVNEKGQIQYMYAGSSEYEKYKSNESVESVQKWTNVKDWVCVYDNYYALMEDGSLQSFIQDDDWGVFRIDGYRNVKKMRYSLYSTRAMILLKDDGTVSCLYDIKMNDSERYNTYSWKDIIDVDTKYDYLWGLTKDRGIRIVSCDEDEKIDPAIERYTDVVNAAVYQYYDDSYSYWKHNHILILHSDGTISVHATDDHKDETLIKEVSKWDGVVNLQNTEIGLIAYRYDGTLYYYHHDYHIRKSEVEKWRDVLHVDSVEEYHSYYGRRYTDYDGNETWKEYDSGYDYYAAGLCADGTVVTTGNGYYYVESKIKSKQYKDIFNEYYVYLDEQKEDGEYYKTKSWKLW